MCSNLTISKCYLDYLHVYMMHAFSSKNRTRKTGHMGMRGSMYMRCLVLARGSCIICLEDSFSSH